VRPRCLRSHAVVAATFPPVGCEVIESAIIRTCLFVCACMYVCMYALCILPSNSQQWLSSTFDSQKMFSEGILPTNLLLFPVFSLNG
ncbi:hypothetical protein V3C99_006511, partial [Haemonchus contortus]